VAIACGKTLERIVLALNFSPFYAEIDLRNRSFACHGLNLGMERRSTEGGNYANQIFDRGDPVGRRTLDRAGAKQAG
jgi:hypothetical protein